jgi:site-specific recombinase XerD
MPQMGRRRKQDLHLPPRMRRKGNAFYYDTGTKPRKWIPLGSNESQARLAWAKLENEEHGETVSYLIQHFFGTRVPELALNTQKNYASLKKPIEKAFGKMLIRDVTHEDIATYLDEHWSHASANQQIAILSAMFEKALRRGWADKNPCKGIRRHRVNRRQKYLTDEEFKSIRDVADPILKAVMALSYVTTLRPVDIAKIKHSDVRPDGLYVEEKKTGKRKMYEMSPPLKVALEAARTLPGSIKGLTLICTQTGQPFHPGAFSRLFKDAAHKAGIEGVQLRDIRAKGATDAKEDGQDYQALLGHTTRAMSDSYIKPKIIDRVEPLKRKL